MPSRVLPDDQAIALYARFRSGAATLDRLALEAGIQPMTLRSQFTGLGLSPKWRTTYPSRSFRRRNRRAA